MSDNKLSLEDILNEYSPDPNDTSSTHVGRVDAQKIINSTLPNPVRDKPRTRTAVSHERNELFDDNKEHTPANEVKPAELSRKQVAFAGSDGLSDVKSAHEAENTDEYSDLSNSAPKIRRMSDSTRAREAERNNRKKKRRFKKSKETEKRTYSKETPDGEYMYTPPKIKKKKRTRSDILSEIEGSNRKCVTDIVPSPEALEATRPVQPAPRAEKTSIDLSRKDAVSPDSLDVHVSRDAEEFAKSKTKDKRTKRIVDFNYYGDVQDVGRDIYELKNILSTRVTVLALTAFLSVYITICSRFDLPIINILNINHIHTFLITHLLLGMLAIFYSMPVITKGLKNLAKLKADGDSMTAITVLTCLISLLTAFLKTDMARQEIIHVYMPVGILALLFNAVGKLLILKRAKRNFNFISRSFDRHAVVYVRDEERAERLTRGTLGDFPITAAMRPTDFLTDFLRYSYSADITDNFCKKAAPLCLIVSAVTSVFLTMFRTGTLLSVESVTFGFSIFSMLICACSCISLPFTANIPLEKISKQTLAHKGILLGYQSVDDLYDANSILVDANTLFPEGSIKLGGIKVFSNTKLDEALLDAASLTVHAGSVMRRLFTDVIHGKESLLYPIDNFSYEENMGICGWINNRRILFGSRELMASHNIEGIPTLSQEAEYADGHEPLYLSISGNLAAMFVVDINGDRNVKKWAERLAKKKICMIVKSMDVFITEEKIASVYGISKEFIKVIPKKLHEDFDAETSKVVRMSASMACTGRFSSMAQLILGIKVIHSSAIIGLIIQSVSILLGFGLSMMLILSKAFEFDYIYMSATAMIIYNLICTAATCISINIKKL